MAALAATMENLMVVVFDVLYTSDTITQVHHSHVTIGAVVATLNNTFSRYFNTVSKHNNWKELRNNLTMAFTECLQTYRIVNGRLPDKIIFYRTIDADIELTYVYAHELKHLQSSLDSFYMKEGVAAPKFTFIVVTKKTITSYSPVGRPGNPSPATVVGDVITLSKRFGFYMVPAAKKGMTSPWTFNVLYDTQGWEADKVRLQCLTYKISNIYSSLTLNVIYPVSP